MNMEFEIKLKLDEDEINYLKFYLEEQVEIKMRLNKDNSRECYLLEKLYSKVPGIVNLDCETSIKDSFTILSLKL